MRKIFLILFFISLIIFNCASNEEDNNNNILSSQDTQVIKDTIYIINKDTIFLGFDDYIKDSIYYMLRDSIYNMILNQVDDSVVAHIVLDSIFDSLYYIYSRKYENDLDSLYNIIYSNIYNDIYSNSASNYIDILAIRWHSSITSSFLSYYPNIYKYFPILRGIVNIVLENTANTYYIIKVEGYIGDYTENDIETIILNPGEIDTVNILPYIKPTALDSLNEGVNTNIYLKISVLNNDKEVPIFENSYETYLTSKNTFSWGLYDPSGNFIDLSNYIALWVTPNVDSIQTILHEAAEIYPIVGYQEVADTIPISESVYNQVKAIYEVLQRRGILYVDNITTYEGDQKIKFPQEVLETKNANCIEGVILFASILEAIGINPLIVLIPGHAFLGWVVEKNSTTSDFLETTLAWDGASFEYANNVGRDEYNQELLNGNFDTGESQIVDIKFIRENLEIYPIGLNKLNF